MWFIIFFGSYVTIRDPNLSIELKLVKDTNMSNDISAEATSTKANNDDKNHDAPSLYLMIG